MKDIERLIANIHFDVDTGEDFFEAVAYRTSEIQHVELGNGMDAITSRDAEEISYKKKVPCTPWDLETVWAFAQEFKMKVVALKKHDGDQWYIPDWDITNDFDEYDCSKGLNIMDYCKDIEDAYVFDTIDDVEEAYNEYTDNLKDEFFYDNDSILLEELDKARKGKEEIIEQVKSKSPSEFVMIPAVDFDTDGLEIMPKFSTMFYDDYNGVTYALGLIFNKD